MGSLVKRGNVYHMCYRIHGRQYSETSRTSDRDTAEELLKARLRERGLPEAISRRVFTDPGVYFLRSKATGLTKIGCSGDVFLRIENLRRANADLLEIVAIIKSEKIFAIEQLFHLTFAAYRRHGEWFALSD